MTNLLWANFLSDVLVMKVLLGEGILKNFALFLCFVFPDPIRDYDETLKKWTPFYEEILSSWKSCILFNIYYTKVSSMETQKKGVPVSVPTVTSQLHLAMLRSIRIFKDDMLGSLEPIFWDDNCEFQVVMIWKQWRPHKCIWVEYVHNVSI